MEDALQEICAFLHELYRSPRVSISRRNTSKNQIEVLARSAGVPRVLDMKYSVPGLQRSKPTHFVRDVFDDPLYVGHPIFDDFPQLKSIASYWLCNKDSMDHFLFIWNPPAAFFTDEVHQANIVHIIGAIKSILCEPPQPQIEPANFEGELVNVSGLQESGSSQPLSQFLDATLVKKQRLLARNSASYLALRQWRKPIKNYQIDALVALKNSLSTPCVELIASQMADAVKKVYGSAFQTIVPIPGGSSGRELNFATMISMSMATKLGLKFENALKAEPTTHPSKSAKMAPYQLVKKLEGNVLIVDDVATSGRHVELATMAIRPHVAYCTSVVWISD
jgi:orotate phosphoribosyltransferase-like protein